MNTHASGSSLQNAHAAPTSQIAGSAGPSSVLTNRLYVGNLAASVDEYALVQVFQKYGKLTKLDFMYHKTGVLKGKPRGYAFVEWQNKEDAQKAMTKLHDRLLRGRKLVVTAASSAPPDNAPLPTGTRGRRSEPAKQTTLSLLKSKQKPTTAAAQIAAMEAKLANMQSRKPADEDWVPGQSFSIPGSSGVSAPGSREGSAAVDGGLEGEEGALGEEEARKAAADLEKEMAEMVGLPVKDAEAVQPTEGNAEEAASARIAGLPAKPTGGSSGAIKAKATLAKGLATLPPKPAFL